MWNKKLLKLFKILTVTEHDGVEQVTLRIKKNLNNKMYVIVPKHQRARTHTLSFTQSLTHSLALLRSKHREVWYGTLTICAFFTFINYLKRKMYFSWQKHRLAFFRRVHIIFLVVFESKLKFVFGFLFLLCAPYKSGIRKSKLS